MAAVFIPPSPQTSITMSSRRAPLANVSNASNSPRRGALLASKRSHPGNSQLESATFHEPPSKKQMLDREDAIPRNSFRKSSWQTSESKLFSRKNENAPPSAFERKLVAVREKEKQPSQRPVNGTKNLKVTGDSLESVRQWQKHYRKVFPQFVFYFESVPDDIRYKCSKQVALLGAQEEKFFSKSVTHVVTSRPIPVDIESFQTAGVSQDTLSLQPQTTNGPVETVNPTLLDRAMPSRGRHRAPTQERQEGGANMDILHRARKMNMKIWTLDKLQRVVSTMNDMDVTPHQGQVTRSNTTTHGRGRAENDLSMALRNEKMHRYSDRDNLRDTIPFKGPFIYVHDMDEKTRPVMVREYPKVARRQDGTWPQFRSARIGKCPFLFDEPKKEPEQPQKPAPKPKQVAAAATKALPPPEPPFKENKDPDARMEELFDLEHRPENTVSTKRFKKRPRPASPRKYSEPQRFTGMNMAHILKQDWSREPAASGVQPSNITSAIRSQMISSAAGVSGAKAGTSKEVHELKRKVLEKSNGIVPMGGTSSSHRPTDMAVANRPARAPVPRAAKAKAQGNLVPIHENVREVPSQEQKTRTNQEPIKKPGDSKKVPDKKKDPKPGYCENCREKFDDFDEHVTTRKHRKFALNPSNWAELDGLLDLLTRPGDYSHDGQLLDPGEETY